MSERDESLMSEGDKCLMSERDESSDECMVEIE